MTLEQRKQAMRERAAEIVAEQEQAENGRPEVLMSPGGEIVMRWARGHAWTLYGGTHDGEVVEDSAVEGWTPLEPRAETPTAVRTADGTTLEAVAHLLWLQYESRVHPTRTWAEVVGSEREAWIGDAQMVLGFLVNARGWKGQ